MHNHQCFASFEIYHSFEYKSSFRYVQTILGTRLLSSSSPVNRGCQGDRHGLKPVFDWSRKATHCPGNMSVITWGLGEVCQQKQCRQHNVIDRSTDLSNRYFDAIWKKFDNLQRLLHYFVSLLDVLKLRCSIGRKSFLANALKELTLITSLLKKYKSERLMCFSSVTVTNRHS